MAIVLLGAAAAFTAVHDGVAMSALVDADGDIRIAVRSPGGAANEAAWAVYNDVRAAAEAMRVAPFTDRSRMCPIVDRAPTS